MKSEVVEKAPRVTLVAGHYGSGKTNFALSWARSLKSLGGRVAVGDLDIVNPYFRTKDSAARLADEGIELVVSDFANSNVDFPALPKEIYSLVYDRDVRVVFDVGGDDRGALALGRYMPGILEENDYAFWAVVNRSRPLTRTVGDTVEVLREIEAAAGARFTGVVNDTNLGAETTAATVIDSIPYAQGVADSLAVPLALNCCAKSLYPELRGRVDNLFAIDIQRLYYQLRES